MDRLSAPLTRLLVFAKAPVPGRVKTRLAGVLGTRGAARLYRVLLLRTLAMATATALGPVRLGGSAQLGVGF